MLELLWTWRTAAQADRCKAQQERCAGWGAPVKEHDGDGGALLAVLCEPVRLEDVQRPARRGHGRLLVACSLAQALVLGGPLLVRGTQSAVPDMMWHNAGSTSCPLLREVLPCAHCALRQKILRV